MDKFKRAESPLVSLVISNYNGLKYGILGPCLKSIFSLRYPDFEVILVDNASTDGSIDFVRKQFGANNIKIVKNKRNIYTEGLNEGVRVSDGKYIIFLNNDIRVNSEYVEKLVEILENDQHIALAQGLLLTGKEPQRIDNAGDFMDIYGNPTTRGRGEIDNAQYSSIEEILSASGSAFIIRRDVFREVGLFDPTYHIGYEDMDLALRIHLRGYKVVYIPNSIVYHDRAVTDEAPENRLMVRFHFNKNRLMTLIRNYSLKNLAKSILILVSLYFMAFLWETLVQKDVKLGMTRFSGLFWNLKELKYILKKRTYIQNKVRLVKNDSFLRHMSKSGVSILAFMKAGKQG